MVRARSSSTQVILRHPTRLQHVEDDDLEEYLMGRLSDNDGAQLEEHLLICESCRGRLVEVEETIRLIREAMRSIRLVGSKKWGGG
jgi:anti-sigma factor RsiW